MAAPKETDSKPVLDPSQWVDLHGDFLYAYAVTRLRDGEAAEEVVQESFVAALRNVKQYSGAGSERAWLLGILKRKIIDLVRQRNRAASLDELEGRDPAEVMFDKNGSWRKSQRATIGQPLDGLEREEFWEVFRACLAGIPPRQADVFALRELEEQSTDEICGILQISASNLWVLLHRARLQLSVCMKSRWQRDTL